MFDKYAITFDLIQVERFVFRTKHILRSLFFNELIKNNKNSDERSRIWLNSDQ